MLIAVLTTVALLTAVLSGMMGIGGGTILIAVMYAVGLPPVVAVPLHAAVQMVSNGSRTIAYLSHVRWSAFGWFLLGAVPAPFVMAPLVASANPNMVRLLMAAFILVALWPQWLQRIRLHGRTGMIVAGGLAGGVGSVVGASGPLISPFFLREGWAKEQVIATLAVCQSVAHGLKIIAFASLGFVVFEQWPLLLPMALAVIAGTIIGRLLIGRFKESAFRATFRALLMLLALKLIWDGVNGLVINTLI